jgi:hypothetical protein
MIGVLFFILFILAALCLIMAAIMIVGNRAPFGCGSLRVVWCAHLVCGDSDPDNYCDC